MVSTGKEHPMNTGAWEHPKAFAEVGGRTGKNKRFKAFGRKVMMMETIVRLMHSRDYSNYGTKVPLYEHAGDYIDYECRDMEGSRGASKTRNKNMTQAEVLAYRKEQQKIQGERDRLGASTLGASRNFHKLEASLRTFPTKALSPVKNTTAWYVPQAASPVINGISVDPQHCPPFDEEVYNPHPAPAYTSQSGRFMTTHGSCPSRFTPSNIHFNTTQVRSTSAKSEWLVPGTVKSPKKIHTAPPGTLCLSFAGPLQKSASVSPLKRNPFGQTQLPAMSPMKGGKSPMKSPFG